MQPLVEAVLLFSTKQTEQITPAKREFARSNGPFPSVCRQNRGASQLGSLMLPRWLARHGCSQLATGLCV